MIAAILCECCLVCITDIRSRSTCSFIVTRVNTVVDRKKTYILYLHPISRSLPDDNAEDCIIMSQGRMHILIKN